VVLSKTHRLLVPAGLNGAVPGNPALHFLGVEADAGSYDVSTTPARMFSTSLGTVTFKPGTIKFFYDPAAKSLSALPPPPPASSPMLCFSARTGSEARHLDDGSVRDAASLAHRPRLRLRQREPVGPSPAEAWVVCFNQKTKDALNPPNVFLTTQDLGQSPTCGSIRWTRSAYRRKSSRKSVSSVVAAADGGGHGASAPESLRPSCSGACHGGHFLAACV
jgi:hypothetical protein